MRCLALDVGDRWVGVAVGERLACPLTNLRRRSKVQDFAAIARLIREQQADTLVVGLPLNMDGSLGFQARRVVRYAEQLRDDLSDRGVKVALVFWDERLTTERAREMMFADGRRPRDRRRRLDAVAAAVILQSYLDHVNEGAERSAMQ